VPELEVYVADVLELLRASPDFELHWRRGQVLSIAEAKALGLGLGGIPRLEEALDTAPAPGSAANDA